MVEMLNFLSEKARGLLLTVAGTGAGKAATFVETIVPKDTTILEKLQILSYAGAITVAALTTISYLYKFYLWIYPKIRDKYRKIKN